MFGFRLILASLVCFALAAQQEPSQKTFRTTVNVVVAPTTVTDRSGSYINGLTAKDFRLFDNDKPQDIRADVAFIPLSIVVAVQANAAAEHFLPEIKKVSSLLQPLVAGEQGEVAVVAFDHRIRTLQNFTSDANQIAEAFKKITPGSSSSRLTDAVIESVHMLRNRPSNRRRVLLLISETRDMGSEGKVRNALIDLQLNNVSVYTVNLNRLITTLTAKAPPPRPDPIPPTARPMPAGVPPTPSAVAQTTGVPGSVIPLVVEILKDVKGIFVDNPVEAFTKGTGGREHSFLRQRDLERAISQIGDELHSQYIISYNPDNKMEAGFHEIRVEVVNRRDLKVLTRPGYWLAAVPD